MEFHTRSEQETEAVGARLAAQLSPGAVVAYEGGLGMGKTAFTRGLAAGLGYRGRVTSPTFTIVNEYEGGRLPLFHFDMYRLPSADALFDIGWEDYLLPGAASARWSGVRMWPKLCRRTPFGFGLPGRGTPAGSLPLRE